MEHNELWELNLKNLQNGAFGDPTSYQALLLYWQAQAAAGFPYASENVLYYKDLIERQEWKYDAKTAKKIISVIDDYICDEIKKNTRSLERARTRKKRIILNAKYEAYREFTDFLAKVARECSSKEAQNDQQ